MASWGGLIASLAYIFGLLATGITDFTVMGGVSIAGGGVFAIGAIAGIAVPRFWRTGPTQRQWWIAGLIGWAAASYCLWTTPRPAANDVSRFASQQEQRVLGEVLEMPRTTRHQKGQFFFRAHSISRRIDWDSFSRKDVSGKLYVTAHLTPSKRLYPGQLVELKGKVLKIESSTETDKSSFGDYLAKKGCFAKFKTRWVEFLPNQTPPRWAIWRLRQRIVAAQARWLGEPTGNLLSAMTLGRKAVDLPFDVRDNFIQAGLAHTLAASGFHVSLILGLVLGGLRAQPPQRRAIAGALTLLMYVGLTGLQPSVVRASVMGLGALVGLAAEQQVKPLGCLLVAASLILLWNPQWIWDVGFQLSAVATLGLIVTVPHLMARMDWLPTNVATLLAVPMAAYLWTIPLQLYYFEVLPPYSIILNSIATPLVVVISVGGFVSAATSMVLPVLGSAIAALFYYPIHLLIWLVERFNQLPASSVEVKGIGSVAVIISYGVYAAICIWLWRKEQKQQARFESELEGKWV